MQKSVRIILTVFLLIVGGTFSAAIVRKKFVRDVVKEEKKTDATQAPRTPSHDQNAVFYTSIGGSTDNRGDTTENSSISSRYTIEVAQVTSQTEAEQLLLRMKERGIGGFYTPVRRGGQVIYRVRLGVFVSAEDAAQSLAKIAGRTQFKGQVTKLQ